MQRNFRRLRILYSSRYSSWIKRKEYYYSRIWCSKILLLTQVGYYAAKYMCAYGAKLVGVAEWDGSIYDENGFDPDEL